MGVATKSSKARDLPGQQSRLKNAEFHRKWSGAKHARKMPLYIPRMLHMKLELSLQTSGGEQRARRQSWNWTGPLFWRIDSATCML